MLLLHLLSSVGNIISSYFSYTLHLIQFKEYSVHGGKKMEINIKTATHTLNYTDPKVEIIF